MFAQCVSVYCASCLTDIQVYNAYSILDTLPINIDIFVYAKVLYIYLYNNIYIGVCVMQ